MKKMTKRTLSLLLVVAMICSLGVLALADDTAIIFNPSSLTVYVGKTATTTAKKPASSGAKNMAKTPAEMASRKRFTQPGRKKKGR